MASEDAAQTIREADGGILDFRERCEAESSSHFHQGREGIPKSVSSKVLTTCDGSAPVHMAGRARMLTGSLMQR
jgi:hypothetical protein